MSASRDLLNIVRSFCILNYWMPVLFVQSKQSPCPVLVVVPSCFLLTKSMFLRLLRLQIRDWAPAQRALKRWPDIYQPTLFEVQTCNIQQHFLGAVTVALATVVNARKTRPWTGPLFLFWKKSIFWDRKASKDSKTSVSWSSVSFSETNRGNPMLYQLWTFVPCHSHSVFEVLTTIAIQRRKSNSQRVWFEG